MLKRVPRLICCSCGHKHNHYLCPACRHPVCEGCRRAPRRITPKAAAPLVGRPLSAREAEVSEAISQGESNAGIARRLGLNEKTVSTFINRACAKLGIKTRNELLVAMCTERVRQEVRKETLALAQRSQTGSN
jgi:DNA-binding NarL/FixJ family response regulator